MKTGVTISLMLGLGAMIAALLGCGAAPAAQTAETLPESQTSKVAATEAPSASTPTAKMFQADSVPPKAVAAVKKEPESGATEVGYKVGMHVPEFGMSLLDGSRVTSASLVEEGRPVFIFFHATY